MKAINKINFATIICMLCLLVTCLPQTSMAQRFGHGGGGGGRGGGSGMRGGGGARVAPAMGNRSINGGSVNTGAHIFGGNRGGARPVINVRGNEGVYHRAFGSHAYAYHPYH